MSEELLWNWYGTKVHLLDTNRHPRGVTSVCGKVRYGLAPEWLSKDATDPRIRCKFCWRDQPETVTVRRDDLWLIVHHAQVDSPEHMAAWERLCDAAGNEPA